MKAMSHLGLNNLIAAAVMLMLCSCASVVPPTPTASVESGGSPRFIQRAEEFRQAVAGCPEVGFALSEKIIADYQREPAKLAARCSLLGVTEVYCRINPEQIVGFFGSRADYIHELLIQMHRYRIRCYAEIDATDLIALLKRSGELAAFNQIKDMVRNIHEFNRNGKPGGQFDGIIGVILPHRADDMFARRHPSTIYHWTDKGYGIGKENDQMHREARRMMMSLKDTAVNLHVGEYIGSFYHDRTLNNDLSVASVNHYLDVAAFVLVENAASGRAEILSNVAAELRDARRPRSVMVALITSGENYTDKEKQESLQSRSWPEITTTLHSVTQEFKKNATFRGLAFTDYASLEAILSPGQ